MLFKEQNVVLWWYDAIYLKDSTARVIIHINHVIQFTNNNCQTIHENHETLYW